MRTFVVNGKEYNAKPFDFNLICDLEDRGIALATMVIKPNVAMRVYLAMCGKMSLEKAGEEITQHISSGELLDGLSDVMAAEIDESDFFQKVLKNAAQELKKIKENTKA